MAKTSPFRVEAAVEKGVRRWTLLADKRRARPSKHLIKVLSPAVSKKISRLGPDALKHIVKPGLGAVAGLRLPEGGDLDERSLLPPTSWWSASDGDPLQLPQLDPLPPWALVLSGGGAKGAFQVGAMQYLFREKIRPRAIAGTSVGAVNALGIAERSWAGLDKIVETWLGVNSIVDLYEAENWVREADDIAEFDLRLEDQLVGAEPRSLAYDQPGTLSEDLLGEVVRGVRNAASTLSSTMWATQIPVLGHAIPLAADLTVDRYKRAVGRLSRLAATAQGLLNFGPLERLLIDKIDPAAIASAGTLLRLTMVSVEDGTLCAATESGTVNRYDWSHRNLGMLSPRHLLSVVPDGQEYVRAALCSASIPGFNPPRQASAKPHRRGDPNPWMVDGGVRQVLPVDQGLELLDRLEDSKGIVAIGAGPVHARKPLLPELQSPPLSLDRYGFEGIAARSAETVVGEVAADEIVQLTRLPEDIDRLLVFPAIAVGGTADVDPGLVQIQMSYGYMRAFDASLGRRRLGEVAPDVNALGSWMSSETITELRLACWTLERTARAFRHEYPSTAALPGVDLPTEDAFPFDAIVGTAGFGFDERARGARTRFIAVPWRIRELKRELATAIEERVRAYGLESLPSVHDLSNPAVGNDNAFGDWCLQWERHSVAPGGRRRRKGRGGTGRIGERVPGYPTGPGMVDPATNTVHQFERFSTPFSSLSYFDFRGRRNPGASHLDGQYGAPLSRLRHGHLMHAEDPPALWSRRSPDYNIVRHEGYILAHDPGGAHPAITIRSVYKTDSNNLLSSDPQQLRGIVGTGYGDSSDEGLVFAPGRKAPPGTVPLWTFYSESRDDTLTSSDVDRFGNEKDAARPREALPPDYRFVRHEGFVYSPDLPQPPGTKPLYRWVSFGRRDHNTVAHPSWVPKIEGTPVINSPEST